jgi:hypothetical protein
MDEEDWLGKAMLYCTQHGPPHFVTLRCANTTTSTIADY